MEVLARVGRDRYIDACAGVTTVIRVWRYPRRVPDPNLVTNQPGRNYSPHDSAEGAGRHFAPRLCQTIKIVECV